MASFGVKGPEDAPVPENEVQRSPVGGLVPNNRLKLTGAASCRFEFFWFIQRPRQLSLAFDCLGSQMGDAAGNRRNAPP